jgi:acetyl esterase/lipase
MKILISFSLLLMISLGSFSQKRDLIYLWPTNVPGETGEKKGPVTAATENDNILRISEVTNPAMEAFLPEKSVKNKAAVVVCPGGGYHILAYDLEGTEIAAWLNKNGYAAFVLQYRVPDKKEGAIQDIQRAVRIIRKEASEYGVDPSKIGVMGFSAGGSLTARAATNFSRQTYTPVDKTDSLSCRPSFAMLIYPAYLDQGPGLTLTPELHLSKDVPPVFIFQTADDQYGNSALVMAQALRNEKLPVELHLLPYGGHGYGLRPGKIAAETWPILAEKWLKSVIMTNQKE